MPYKVETLYTSEWDDAEWTEENEDEVTPLRFETDAHATTALQEFFADIKAGVQAGNIDAEENPAHYRIAEVME